MAAGILVGWAVAVIPGYILYVNTYNSAYIKGRANGYTSGYNHAVKDWETCEIILEWERENISYHRVDFNPITCRSEI